MRRATIAIALAVIVGLGVALVIIADERQRSAARNVAQEQTERPRASEPLGPDEVSPPTRSPVDGEPDHADASSTANPVGGGEESEVGPRVLSGTIDVVDASGVVHSLEEGYLSVSIHDTVPWRVESVPVHRGQFGFALPRDVPISIDHAELGGRVARIDPAVVQKSIPSDFIELHAAWWQGPVLRVTERSTGLDLDMVELRQRGAWSARHPGGLDSEPDVSGAVSPIDLTEVFGESWTSDVHLWVGAPGYAWDIVAIDMSSGGERLAALVTGSGLVVELLGKEPEPDSALRLWPEGGEIAPSGPSERDIPILDFGLRPGERSIEFDGLVPGSYRAIVQVGHWWEGHPVQGEAIAVVTAGTKTLLPIELEQRAEALLHPVAGTIRFGVGWDLELFDLELQLQDPMLRASMPNVRVPSTSMQREAPSSWRWRGPDLAAGSWVAVVEPSAHRTPFELGPGGNQAVEIDVPAEATVELELVHADGGEPFEPQSVWWRAEGDDSNVQNWLGTSDRTGPGLYQFAAGAVPIVIYVVDRDNVAKHEVTLAPGPNRVEFRVPRPMGMVLRFFDGESRVPFTLEERPVIEAVAGEGRFLTCITGPEPRIFVTAPGAYLLTPPNVPGFASPDQIEVEVLEGEFAEVSIQLDRLP